MKLLESIEETGGSIQDAITTMVADMFQVELDEAQVLEIVSNISLSDLLALDKAYTDGDHDTAQNILGPLPQLEYSMGGGSSSSAASNRPNPKTDYRAAGRGADASPVQQKPNNYSTGAQGASRQPPEGANVVINVADQDPEGLEDLEEARHRYRHIGALQRADEKLQDLAKEYVSRQDRNGPKSVKILHDMESIADDQDLVVKNYLEIAAGGQSDLIRAHEQLQEIAEYYMQSLEDDELEGSKPEQISMMREMARIAQPFGLSIETYLLAEDYEGEDPNYLIMLASRKDQDEDLEEDSGTKIPVSHAIYYASISIHNQDDFLLAGPYNTYQEASQHNDGAVYGIHKHTEFPKKIRDRLKQLADTHGNFLIKMPRKYIIVDDNQDSGGVVANYATKSQIKGMGEQANGTLRSARQRGERQMVPGGLRAKTALTKLAQEYNLNDEQYILDAMERIAKPLGLDINDYLDNNMGEDYTHHQLRNKQEVAENSQTDIIKMTDWLKRRAGI